MIYRKTAPAIRVNFSKVTLRQLQVRFTDLGESRPNWRVLSYRIRLVEEPRHYEYCTSYNIHDQFKAAQEAIFPKLIDRWTYMNLETAMSLWDAMFRVKHEKWRLSQDVETQLWRVLM